MSSDSSTYASSAGSELCVSCGLCCRGIIFNRAALRSEEIGLAKKHGLQYFSNGEEGYAFRLPCRLYRDERCPIYLGRPSACKRYKCKLLKRVMSGEITLNEGLTIASRANSLMSSISELMTDQDETKDFRQKVQKILNLQYKNQMLARGSYAPLLKDIESFYIILHQYFEDKAG